MTGEGRRRAARSATKSTSVKSGAFLSKFRSGFETIGQIEPTGHVGTNGSECSACALWPAASSVIARNPAMAPKMESRGHKREGEEQCKLAHICFEGSACGDFFQGAICVNHRPNAPG